jgi:hypothetical protein
VISPTEFYNCRHGYNSGRLWYSEWDGHMRYTDWLRLFPLLFLISVSSSSSQQRDSSPTLPVYEDADAYEVYSATLPMDSSYQDSKAVLILQSVPPSEWPIGSPREALHGDSEFNKTFAPIFGSFDKANQESRSLEHHFSIPKPYKLLNKDEIDRHIQASCAERIGRRVGRVSGSISRISWLHNSVWCRIQC